MNHGTGFHCVIHSHYHQFDSKLLFTMFANYIATTTTSHVQNHTYIKITLSNETLSSSLRQAVSTLPNWLRVVIKLPKSCYQIIVQLDNLCHYSLRCEKIVSAAYSNSIISNNLISNNISVFMRLTHISTTGMSLSVTGRVEHNDHTRVR